MLAPAPGSAPTRVPITEPRRKVGSRRRATGIVRPACPARLATATSSRGSSIMAKASAMAKTPISTTRKGMPSSSSYRSKVKRGEPDTGSTPTVTRISPSTAAVTPLITLSPHRLAISDKAE